MKLDLICAPKADYLNLTCWINSFKCFLRILKCYKCLKQLILSKWEGFCCSVPQTSLPHGQTEERLRLSERTFFLRAYPRHDVRTRRLWRPAKTDSIPVMRSLAKNNASQTRYKQTPDLNEGDGWGWWGWGWGCVAVLTRSLEVETTQLHRIGGMMWRHFFTVG